MSGQPRFPAPGSTPTTIASASVRSEDPDGAIEPTDPHKRIKLSEGARAVAGGPPGCGAEARGAAEGTKAQEPPQANGGGATSGGGGGGGGLGPDGGKEPVQDDPVHALVCGWSGKQYRLELPGSDLVGDLKTLLFSLTSVPPGRQKIVGLVPGKLPLDDVPIASLNLGSRKGKAFTMIGTPEGAEVRRPEEMPDVANDLDVDYAAALVDRSSSPANSSRNKRKLKEAADKLELNIMNPIRPGKKLLVLDLDYTLMDAKAYSDFSTHALDMARPYLQEFLTALSPYYDFCIWSQTAWRWLESKLVELNMVGGVNDDKYLINFVIDRSPMFSVYSNRKGEIIKHEVKALEIIWRKLPVYNPANTLHLDDLSRNFAMNPRNGVRCHAFKNARQNKRDRELVHLTRYFLQMALVPDVREYDHSKWSECELDLPEGCRDPRSDLPSL